MPKATPSRRGLASSIKTCQMRPRWIRKKVNWTAHTSENKKRNKILRIWPQSEDRSSILKMSITWRIWNICIWPMMREIRSIFSENIPRSISIYKEEGRSLFWVELCLKNHQIQRFSPRMIVLRRLSTSTTLSRIKFSLQSPRICNWSIMCTRI